MEEDTSAETSPAAVESESGPEASETAQPADESLPNTDAKPDATKPADDASKGEAKPGEAPPKPQKVDPQLIVLCLILWVVAMGILLTRYEEMRIDWHLGNIKETLGPLPKTAEVPAPVVDEQAVNALIDMAGDADVVGALHKELDNRGQIDPRYRVIMIIIAERIPGDASFDLLATKGARDYDSNVRVNSYLALLRRSQAGTVEQREQAFRILHESLTTDPDPVATLPLINCLGDLADPRAAWDIIKILRVIKPNEVRKVPLGALRKISGKTEESLPFDVEAEGEAFIVQMVAWENWFTGQGGTIPPNEDIRSLPPPPPEKKPSEEPDGPSDGPDKGSE